MSMLRKAFWKTLWEDKKILLWAILAVIIALTSLYFYFQFMRSWNYTFGYESRVQGTVCEMVKFENLTPEGRRICD